VTLGAASSPHPPSRVGYLGPTGTFTEQALRSEPDLSAAELVSFSSIPDVLFAVDDGTVDIGFVAIENAIEGSVTATVDTLAFETDLVILRETVMRVQLNLLAPPGTRLGDVTRIVSIPIAAAQCRHFVRGELPGAVALAANSTAEAAERVAREADGVTAAIAPARAGEVYGLEALAVDIEDHPENRTRFVAVAREGIPAPTGHDKSSIVVFQRTDRPGSLLAILQEFAARSINLTRLESRPTKQSLGDYCFFIDLEGHIADEVVADCLRTLHMRSERVKYLGSYPAAGAQGPQVRRESEQSRRDADAWIAGLRASIR
jgi:prephenate dehydratase